MNVVPQNGTALSGRKGKPGPFRNKKIACILGLSAGSQWEIFSRGGGCKLGQMGLDPGIAEIFQFQNCLNAFLDPRLMIFSNCQVPA